MSASMQNRSLGAVWAPLLAVGLIALATWRGAEIYSWGVETAIQFAGHVALGPFAMCLHHGRILPAIPLAAFIGVIISFHFVRPSATAFCFTLIGTALWVGAGFVFVTALA
jgi:type III secretory pathway component EscS